MADKFSLSMSIAKVLGVPHIGCCNHVLSLDVKDMISTDALFGETFNSVRQAMRTARQNIKTRAMLRNITALSGIIDNQNRWHRCYQMIRRFSVIFDHVVAVSNNENVNISMNSHEDFRARAVRFEK